MDQQQALSNALRNGSSAPQRPQRPPGMGQGMQRPQRPSGAAPVSLATVQARQAQRPAPSKSQYAPGTRLLQGGVALGGGAFNSLPKWVQDRATQSNLEQMLRPVKEGMTQQEIIQAYYPRNQSYDDGDFMSQIQRKRDAEQSAAQRGRMMDQAYMDILRNTQKTGSYSPTTDPVAQAAAKKAAEEQARKEAERAQLPIWARNSGGAFYDSGGG